MSARILQFPAPIPARPAGMSDQDYIDMLVGADVADLAADMLAQSRRAQMGVAS